MKNSRSIGQSGEDAVVKYLREQGFRVLYRNWRYGHLEVDVIAAHADGIAFIEVKARSNRSFGYPESFVNGNKQRLLKRAANAYAHIKKYHGEIRFDIAAVMMAADGSISDIRYFEDAFY